MRRIVSFLLTLTMLFSIGFAALAEEMPAAAPAEVNADTPTEAPTEAPVADEPTDTPTEAPVVDEPTDTPTEAPVADEPTDTPTEAPVADEPTDEPTEAPVVTDEPTDAPTEAPVTDEPTDLLTPVGNESQLLLDGVTFDYTDEYYSIGVEPYDGKWPLEFTPQFVYELNGATETLRLDELPVGYSIIKFEVLPYPPHMTELFSAAWNKQKGVVELSLKEGMEVEVNGYYELFFIMTYENPNKVEQVIVTSPVNIYVHQKMTVKLGGGKINVWNEMLDTEDGTYSYADLPLTLSLTTGGRAYFFDINSNYAESMQVVATSPAGYEDGFTFDNGRPQGNRKGTIELDYHGKKPLKDAGKTLTLIVRVNFSDFYYNAPALATVKLTLASSAPKYTVGTVIVSGEAGDYSTAILKSSNKAMPIDAQVVGLSLPTEGVDLAKYPYQALFEAANTVDADGAFTIGVKGDDSIVRIGKLNKLLVRVQTSYTGVVDVPVTLNFKNTVTVKLAAKSYTIRENVASDMAFVGWTATPAGKAAAPTSIRVTRKGFDKTFLPDENGAYDLSETGFTVRIYRSYLTVMPTEASVIGKTTYKLTFAGIKGTQTFTVDYKTAYDNATLSKKTLTLNLAAQSTTVYEGGYSYTNYADKAALTVKLNGKNVSQFVTVSDPAFDVYIQEDSKGNRFLQIKPNKSTVTGLHTVQLNVADATLKEPLTVAVNVIEEVPKLTIAKSMNASVLSSFVDVKLSLTGKFNNSSVADDLLFNLQAEDLSLLLGGDAFEIGYYSNYDRTLHLRWKSSEVIPLGKAGRINLQLKWSNRFGDGLTSNVMAITPTQPKASVYVDTTPTLYLDAPTYLSQVLCFPSYSYNSDWLDHATLQSVSNLDTNQKCTTSAFALTVKYGRVLYVSLAANAADRPDEGFYKLSMSVYPKRAANPIKCTLYVFVDPSKS